MTGGIQWNLRNSTRISATTGPKEGGGGNRRRRPRLGSLVAGDGAAGGRIRAAGSLAWADAPGIGGDEAESGRMRRIKYLAFTNQWCGLRGNFLSLFSLVVRRDGQVGNARTRSMMGCRHRDMT